MLELVGISGLADTELDTDSELELVDAGDAPVVAGEQNV